MNREDCVELGYISKAHGIRGELKAVLDVHDLREYLKVKTLYLAKPEQPLQAVQVRSLRPQRAKLVILSLEGITDRSAAEALIGHTIFFPVSQLPELEEGHFYYFEVIGFEIEDERLGKLGTVKSFADAGAQDLLVMTYQGQEILIPVVDEFIGKADKARKVLHTSLPEGLIDIYLDAPEKE
jgi:16S rRNA processing protein RimM